LLADILRLDFGHATSGLDYTARPVKRRSPASFDAGLLRFTGSAV